MILYWLILRDIYAVDRWSTGATKLCNWNSGWRENRVDRLQFWKFVLTWIVYIHQCLHFVDMQKGIFDRKSHFQITISRLSRSPICCFFLSLIEDQTLLVCRINLTTICQKRSHTRGRKCLIAQIKYTFCALSVTDRRLPFYCGRIRVWLLKPPLNEWGVYVFWSVCGIFTRPANPVAIMTTKGLRLQ